jgi:hypothetical protein
MGGTCGWRMRRRYDPLDVVIAPLSIDCGPSIRLSKKLLHVAALTTFALPI